MRQLTIAAIMVLVSVCNGADEDKGVPSKLVEGMVTSELVSQPVEYYALLPPGYSKCEERLPLLLRLHGGGGSRESLKSDRQMYDDLWNAEELPPMVVVTPSVGPHCFYIDYKDGSEKWETFLINVFLEHIRDKLRVACDRSRTYVLGGSMGGLGALRLAFKHPDIFSIVVAHEPGVMPAFKWEDVKLDNRYWLSMEHWQTLHGDPIDDKHWRNNNPASIVKAKAKEIRESELRIYVDCGNLDFLTLHEGTEFLHRVLWDHDIRHGYNLVDCADHLGPSLPKRGKDGLLFLARTVNPPAPDPDVMRIREKLKEVRKTGGFPGAAEGARQD